MPRDRSASTEGAAAGGDEPSRVAKVAASVTGASRLGGGDGAITANREAVADESSAPTTLGGGAAGAAAAAAAAKVAFAVNGVAE